MNKIDNPLPEMLSMLRTAEINLKKAKTNTILMVQKVKGKWKSKGKGKTLAKGKGKALKTKGGVAKDATCFHYSETGLWKRYFKGYLEDLKKKRSETSSSGAEKLQSIDIG